MSLFRDSKALTEDDLFYKVLVYGPRGVGKSHFALTATQPAVLDLENRAHHFRSLFDFKIAGLDTIESVREGFREIISGRIACKTVVVDSISAMYQRLVDKYTTTNDGGKPVTDYVLVNKDMLAFTGFTFSLRNKNVVMLAHQADKLVRQGKTFTKDGVKGKYDGQIEYAVDFILRFAWEGKQRIAVVEKSVYAAQLPVGSVLRDPSWSALMTAIKGKDVPPRGSSTSPATVAPANGASHETVTGTHVASEAEPHAGQNGHAKIGLAKIRAIESIAQSRGVGLSELEKIIHDVSGGRTRKHDELWDSEAMPAINALQNLVRA